MDSSDPVPGLGLGLRLAALAVLILLAVTGVRSCRLRRPHPVPKPPVVKTEPRRRPDLKFVLPTAQTGLAATSSATVYMPTASGRVESALYGSTRTSDAGNGIRFHEGIDIAPQRRGRDNKPLDDVAAVADGRVAYINAAPGNSSYGRYVVMTHDDPLGTIYTLYAHLDAIAPGLRDGLVVTAGQPLGRMGSSSSSPIPVARAHLHLEIGVVFNTRFEAWHRGRQMTPTHGAWNGLNLFGLDPLRVLLTRAPDGTRALLDVLRAEPAAFTLAFAPKGRPPDYYRRYPDLWEAAPGSACVWMDVSEGGVPLRVRSAPPAPATPATLPAVVAVAERVLGRNGRGLVVRRGNAWTLSAAGQVWLEQMLYE